MGQWNVNNIVVILFQITYKLRNRDFYVKAIISVRSVCILLYFKILSIKRLLINLSL